MENRLISYLYDEGKISGETYLYCIENDIESIDDIRLNEIPDNRVCVYEELQALQSSIAENDNNLPLGKTKDNQNNNSEETAIKFTENSITQQEEEKNYQAVYEDALKEVDTRTKNVLNSIKKIMFYR